MLEGGGVAADVIQLGQVLMKVDTDISLRADTLQERYAPLAIRRKSLRLE